LLAALVIGVALGGCATGYHRERFSGGFSETQLDYNMWRVSFAGNGYTNSERAADFALLRGAELALNGGFTHFAIADAASSTSDALITTPTQSFTTGAHTTTYGGYTFVVSAPTATNTIVCFNGKPDIQAIVYDAHFVYESITHKYGIGRSETKAGRP